jgi:hypothetical protein
MSKWSECLAFLHKAISEADDLTENPDGAEQNLDEFILRLPIPVFVECVRHGSSWFVGDFGTGYVWNTYENGMAGKPVLRDIAGCPLPPEGANHHGIGLPIEGFGDWIFSDEDTFDEAWDARDRGYAAIRNLLSQIDPTGMPKKHANFFLFCTRSWVENLEPERSEFEKRIEQCSEDDPAPETEDEKYDWSECMPYLYRAFSGDDKINSYLYSFIAKMPEPAYLAFLKFLEENKDG